MLREQNSDWKIVLDASAALISAIRTSVPSSNPRYAPTGPSTRCTIRAPRSREAPKPPEVEVERVKQASRRSAGDAVELDRETTAVELVCQGAEELMPAARRRRRELVEESDVRVTGA